MKKKREIDLDRQAFLARFKASAGLIELEEDIAKFRKSNPSEDFLENPEIKDKISEVASELSRYQRL